MRRRLPTFLLVLTVLVTGVYGYVVWAATDELVLRIALGLPFLAIWMIPVLYWSRTREGRTIFDLLLQAFAFLSMGWVSFALVLTILNDLAGLGGFGVPPVYVFAAATACLIVGALIAASGPKIREVEIPLPDLPPELDGFRIAQISDLHVSSLIRRPYVERVKQLTNSLKADIVALTGDIIDGPIHQLGAYAEPLAELEPKGRVFFITGNHEYYAGAAAWTDHFRKMGMNVLHNAHVAIQHKGVEVMIAGVDDPAVRMVDPRGGTDPVEALTNAEVGRSARNPALKILLAHNPKIAEAAAAAGYDVQLSGHTHAGQFLPWTLAVRVVHAPHFAGLSRQGKMWVYVSAGTGTWGPPVRLGTTAELTLLKLVRRAP